MARHHIRQSGEIRGESLMDFIFSHLGWLIAAAIVTLITSTLYWMLHPPSSRTIQIAQTATEQADTMAGNVLVVFSAEISSEVLMALAAKMAKGQQTQLVAMYVIEVPLTLPIDADLPQFERQALEVLTAATEIGRQVGIEIRTRTVRDRQVGPAIIEAAREENARLIVMGTYRELRYAGAPLGNVIEYVAAHTHIDVLVGVSSATASTSMLNLVPPVPVASKGTNRR
jgi:nucleotide-binding universal stress UspA family protein